MPSSRVQAALRVSVRSHLSHNIFYQILIHKGRRVFKQYFVKFGKVLAWCGALTVPRSDLTSFAVGDLEENG